MTRILTPVGNVADFQMWKPKMAMLETAGYHCTVKMGCYIDTNRNLLVTNNNQTFRPPIPEGLCIFIDSDMEFTLDDVKALEEAARTHPIIGAPYRTQKDNGFDCCGNEIGIHSGIVEVPRIGTGFLAINHYVFEHMEYPYFFRPLVRESGVCGVLGEDINFCNNAKKAGFKTYAHYGIKISHKIRKEQLMQNDTQPKPMPPDLDKVVLAIQDLLNTANRAYKTIYAQGLKDQAELEELKKPKETPKE